jgi:hypothetical protein
MQNNFVVYRIKNLKNDRFYFGSTNNFDRRKREHLKAIRARDLRSGNGNYARDAIRYGHQAEDFSIRVVARFDNRIDMLEREQTFLDMYWGTKNCYNVAFEVWDGAVRKMLVAWNMKTLEARHYLSCHSASKDLEIRKEMIKKMLDGKKKAFNFWVVEPWSKRRTVSEVLELYRRSRVRLPGHALNPKKMGSTTPIPGICSIAQLVYRQRDYRERLNSSIKLFYMAPNHQEQF